MAITRPIFSTGRGTGAPARPTDGADQEPPARIPGRLSESEQAAAVLGSRPDVPRTRAEAAAGATDPEDTPMPARRGDVGADGRESSPDQGAGSDQPMSAARVPAPGSRETIPTASSTGASAPIGEWAAVPRSPSADGALSVAVAEHPRALTPELVTDEALAETMRPEDLAKEPGCE